MIEQVPALKELKLVRDKLRDLLSKTDRSDELEKILETTLQDPNALKQLAQQLGVKTDTNKEIYTGVDNES